MPRLIVLILILVVVAAAVLFFLSSQAREVPTQPLEVDVTNAIER